MGKSANNTWRYCPARAVGQASALRRGCCRLRVQLNGRALQAVQRQAVHWSPPRETWTPRASAPSVAMLPLATTPRLAERSRCSRCRSELTSKSSGAWIHSTRRLVVDSDVEDQLLHTIWFVAATIAVVASGGFAFAEDAVDPTAVKSEDGKYLDKEGNPTFKVAPDGTVDRYTYSGYRRYHSECHVCHGPDGEGSTYAPGLKNSLKTMTYPQFMLIVAAGREVIRADKQSKMPALGNNANVRCYIEDIYVYLKARADG